MSLPKTTVTTAASVLVAALLAACGSAAKPISGGPHQMRARAFAYQVPTDPGNPESGKWATLVRMRPVRPGSQIQVGSPEQTWVVARIESLSRDGQHAAVRGWRGPEPIWSGRIVLASRGLDDGPNSPLPPGGYIVVSIRRAGGPAGSGKLGGVVSMFNGLGHWQGWLHIKNGHSAKTWLRPGHYSFGLNHRPPDGKWLEGCRPRTATVRVGHTTHYTLWFGCAVR